MKLRKFLAAACTAAMAFGLAACGSNTDEKETDAPETTAASIDFEDGNYGFVTVGTFSRTADNSVLSVKDFNGSKALFAENQGSTKMYLGFDLYALLGDKITDLATVKMDIGIEYSDGSFSAVAGEVNVYSFDEEGEDVYTTLDEGWSVYLSEKNPLTCTFDVSGINFTAETGNIIEIGKTEESADGDVHASLYIDNIVFLDADGNLLEADTSATMTVPEGYVMDWSEEEGESSGTVLELSESYAGDWGSQIIVDADHLALLDENTPITVYVEYEAGYSFYSIAPMDFNNGWLRIASENDDYNNYTDLTFKTSEEAEEEGLDYHLQNDGFIILDTQPDSFTFTLNADIIEELKTNNPEGSEGVGLGGQVYGVTVYKVVIGGDSETGSEGIIKLDDSYAGDWGAQIVVDSATLGELSGDTTITLWLEYEKGYDYYLIAPVDYMASWAKLALEASDFNYFTDLDFMTSDEAAEAGVSYHLQNDGFIVLDENPESITFTISAECIESLKENNPADSEGVGLAAQVWGVTVYQVQIQ